MPIPRERCHELDGRMLCIDTTCVIKSGTLSRDAIQKMVSRAVVLQTKLQNMHGLVGKVEHTNGLNTVVFATQYK